MLKIISEIFYKSENTCYFCREDIEDLTDNKFVCKECEEKLKLENKEILVDKNTKYMDKLVYSLNYNRFLRIIVKRYKYNEESYLLYPFSKYMIDTIKVFNLEDSIDVILFIPSTKRKKVKKLYNQSELLAKYISDILKKPLKYNLLKIKDSKEQNKLDARERYLNLEGCFIVKNKEELRGKRILLVDDIVTTGTTLSTCSKELIKAGVSSVVALALTSTNNTGRI